MTFKPPVYIKDNAELAGYCAQWQKCPVLAIDTEFLRVQTYYPIPALLQVFDGSVCYLVDPKPISDFSPLAGIFSNRNIIKVLHACSEDLEVFDQIPGCQPAPLYDTQIAAGIAGLGFSMGYSRLVKSLFDIELPKEETRSDWLQRPLSPRQIEYACLDVIYLYQLFEKLETLLDGGPKSAWVLEDGQTMLDTFERSRDPSLAVSRLKNGWRLDEQDHPLLAALAIWREERARAEDRPRNHVLKESTLYSLARTKPASGSDLMAIEELSHRQRKHYGDALLALVDAHSPKTQAEPLFPPPLPKRYGKLVSALKAKATEVANTHHMAPEMLLRKKDIEALIRSQLTQGVFTLPDSLGGWRQTLIGDSLLEICQSGDFL